MLDFKGFCHVSSRRKAFEIAYIVDFLNEMLKQDSDFSDNQETISTLKHLGDKEEIIQEAKRKKGVKVAIYDILLKLFCDD